MSKDNSADSLVKLVRAARRTSLKVLRPEANNGLVAALMQDSDALREVFGKLEQQSALIAFHPFCQDAFASDSFPVVGGSGTFAEPDAVVSESRPGFQSNYQQSNENNSDGAQLTLDQNFIFQQSFTDLVESVSEGITRGRLNVTTPSDSDEDRKSKSKVSAETTTVSVNGKATTAKPVLSGNSAQAVKAQVSVASDSENSNCGGSNLVVQQLQNLVEFFSQETTVLDRPLAVTTPQQASKNANKQSGQQANASATRPHKTLEPISKATTHLADLTAVLSTKPAIVQESSRVEKSSRAKLSGIGESANAVSSRDSVGQGIGAGLLDSQNNNISSTDMLADKLNRSPNLSILEKRVSLNTGSKRDQVLETGSSVLSPIATQKMADALNDYLQEQAQLHGVDLS